MYYTLLSVKSCILLKTTCCCRSEMAQMTKNNLDCYGYWKSSTSWPFLLIVFTVLFTTTAYILWLISYWYIVGMGRTCAAPGCHTGYALKKIEEPRPKLLLFQAPKDPVLQKWQHSLPREDFKLSASEVSASELHLLTGDTDTYDTDLLTVIQCRA